MQLPPQYNGITRLGERIQLNGKVQCLVRKGPHGLNQQPRIATHACQCPSPLNTIGPNHDHSSGEYQADVSPGGGTQTTTVV